MRLTVMGQMAKSVRADDQTELSADLEEAFERLKWNLWHGNVHRALELVDELGAEVIKIEEPNGGDYARSKARQNCSRW
jgi:uncharacterized FlaG/YvyC family protein